MKFFWKIFFTTMFVSVLCAALGGVILIESAFRAQLEGEAGTAREYGEIVFFSLSNALRDPAGTPEEALTQTARSVSIGGVNQKIAFGLADADGNTLFSSLPVQLDRTALLKKTGAGRGGWMLRQAGEKIYLQSLLPAEYLGKPFTVETLRDVTPLFSHREEQTKTLVEIILAMLLFAGLLTFFLSKLLLRRVVRLSHVAQDIADGNLHKRAEVRGGDEIAGLAKNFNAMADRLSEKIDELEDSAARREWFVGAFSHELKTPLTSVIGYADLLRRGGLDEADRSVCADYIFSEGKRLETLSMRLLELIVLRQRVIQPSPCEVGALLAHAADAALSPAEKARITLTLSAEPAVIRMEKALMETVFLNLIDNARKAIDGKGHIEVSGKKTADGYDVTVTDNGRGMEEKELSRITDAFYMVDKSRSRSQGAGIGLAVCSEILALHGFAIHFASVPGAGTAVTVSMPKSSFESEKGRREKK